MLGGVLAAIDWRLVFVVSVPVGLGRHRLVRMLSLREIGIRTKARIDWLGNITFAVGLIGLLVGITYGIQPYGGHVDGLDQPDRADRPDRRGRAADRVLLHRARVEAADVRPEAAADPGVRGRQRRHPAGLDRARRAAVHADHLAAGHLAAAARLRIQGHPALVRHLPAAADRSASSSPGRCPAGCQTSTARARSPPAGCCCPLPRSSACWCCPPTSGMSTSRS